jgi:hypothetical protein
MGLVDDVVGNPIRAAAPSVKGFGSGLAGNIKEAQKPTAVAAPATPPAAQQSMASTQAAADANESTLEGRQGAYMATNNLASFSDKGSGIVRQVSAKGGNPLYTNVGTEQVTNQTGPYTGADGKPTMIHEGSMENKRGIADAANLRRQLDTMTRMRMMSDANDPTITDPRVRQSAAQGLAMMNADRAAGMADQAGQMQLDQVQQMEGFRNELMDPNTSETRKASIRESLVALRGREPRADEWKVIDSTDEMGNKKPKVMNSAGEVFDAEERAKATAARQAQASNGQKGYPDGTRLEKVENGKKVFYVVKNGVPVKEGA